MFWHQLPISELESPIPYQVLDGRAERPRQSLLPQIQHHHAVRMLIETDAPVELQLRCH
jgi:hypothetical protein